MLRSGFVITARGVVIAIQEIWHFLGRITHPLRDAIGACNDHPS